MTVVGWILAGVVSWTGGSAPVPNYGVHTSLSSCEALKIQIEGTAKYSSLRCAEVSVHIPK